jgi:hypothetical protein
MKESVVQVFVDGEQLAGAAHEVRLMQATAFVDGLPAAPNTRIVVDGEVAWSNEGDAAVRLDRLHAFTDRELGLLIGGLEAAEREGTIDHAGKALHAELEQELTRRTKEP